MNNNSFPPYCNKTFFSPKILAEKLKDFFYHSTVLKTFLFCTRKRVEYSFKKVFFSFIFLDGNQNIQWHDNLYLELARAAWDC